MASVSRIADTDMAWEMTEFSRNQIMSQAGTAMLSQAARGAAEHPHVAALTRVRRAPHTGHRWSRWSPQLLMTTGSTSATRTMLCALCTAMLTSALR